MTGKIQIFPRGNEWGRVAVIVLFFTVMANLAESWWLDETGMIAIMKDSFPGMVRSYATEFPMLSLYDVFMWPWLHVFGYSELASRVPSILFGMVTIALTAKTSKLLFPGLNPWIAPVILFTMDPVTRAMTDARHYTMTLAFLAAAFHDWARFLRDGRDRDWIKACAWGGLSVLTKFFAIEAMAFLITACFFGGNWFRRPSRRAQVAGIAITGAFFLAQVPLIIDFTRMSSEHSRINPVAPDKLREFLVYSAFNPALVALAAGLFLLWASRRTPDVHAPGTSGDTRPLTILFAVMAVTPPAVHYLTYLTTNAFVIRPPYMISMYLPSAFMFSGIFRLFTVPGTRRSVVVILTAIIALFTTMTSESREDWRRGAALVRELDSVRAPVVLIQTGLPQANHVRFLPRPFLAAAGVAYGLDGIMVGMPSILTGETVDYLERVIREHGLEKETRPVMMIAKTPSYLVADHLARRLGKRLASLEQNGIIVFMLY
jgi:4-amino-4-deoxy-L-arabinose transferase-like glycosyltransferase